MFATTVKSREHPHICGGRFPRGHKCVIITAKDIMQAQKSQTQTKRKRNTTNHDYQYAIDIGRIGILTFRISLIFFAVFCSLTSCFSSLSSFDRSDIAFDISTKCAT